LFRLPHRDEIIIHKLRIGHTYFIAWTLIRGETPPQCLACQVVYILLHCVSFTNAHVDFFCVTSKSELFLKVASRSIIDSIKELDFIVKFKCMFLSEFQFFSLEFLSFAYSLCYPVYQHLHCSYVLNLSFSNRFLTTRLLQIVLTCFICFISIILFTNSLNSADVPLSNKQTNHQT